MTSTDRPNALPHTPMTSAARLHWHMRALPERSWNAAEGDAPVLILAPHPDDETLGCGGLIAASCAEGRAVHVLVLTDGTRSHPDSKAYPAERLGPLRRAESLQAGQALGLPASRIGFLGLEDARLPHDGPSAERAAEAIAEVARGCGARTLLTTWRHDPHADHLAASLIGARAASLCGAALYEYPVWGWTLPARRLIPAVPGPGFRLDVSGYLEAKRRAIACHRSQLGQVVTDDPQGFCMDATFLGLFTGAHETFLESS